MGRFIRLVPRPSAIINTKGLGTRLNIYIYIYKKFLNEHFWSSTWYKPKDWMSANPCEIVIQPKVYIDLVHVTPLEWVTFCLVLVYIFKWSKAGGRKWRKRLGYVRKEYSNGEVQNLTYWLLGCPAWSSQRQQLLTLNLPKPVQKSKRKQNAHLMSLACRNHNILACII